MTFRTNLTRLFTWATSARRPFRKSLKGRALFAPMADALEDRRLMTLNVWIDNLNALNVQADDNSLQNLSVDYSSSTSTYTITSFNSLENFAIITDTSTGLTITKTDYDPISGNPGFLTIVETSPGNLVSIAISTGDNKDTVNLGATPASLYVNTGGGADSITVSTNPGDTNIVLDGGSGLDSLINSVSSSASATIGQDIYGFPLDSTLSLNTYFDRNTSSSTAQTIYSSDIEDVTNFIAGSTADIDVTVNGQDGITFGNLGNTSLQSVSTIFLTGNSIVTSVLGYSSNDLISVSASNGGFSSFVGIQGTGLPQTNLYGMTPSTGVLRLLGLAGDDTIKVASNVENLIGIVVEGGAGNDYLSADATILGGDGNDTLQGGLGNDSLEGGAGDNLFLISPGDDTLVGGSGFDILALSAVTGRNNDFTITQDQAVPATIDINGDVSSVLMTDVDQISVQGSTRDDLLIIKGTSTTPVPLIAFLGAGDDTVDATLDSSDQRVTVYGEAGLDYYYSGPSFDIFYGGDDSDTYISAPEINFNNFYDGGSGENFAYATGNKLSVFQQISFQYVTSGTGGYVAYSISSIYLDTTGAGTGSYYLEGNAGDNQFLVSDGTTNPSLTDGANSLVLVTGLSVPVYLSGVTVGDVLDVQGNDGSNTYTAMGSNGATLNFQGGAGINQFNILPGATAANFIGTANDVVNLAGSTVGDLVTLSQAGAGVVNLSLNGVTNQVTGAGRFTISTGSGNDNITLSSTDALNITVDGGDNSDLIDSTGVNNALSNLSILAGDGNDTVTGATLATTVIRAGLGDDTVTLLSSGSVYGDDGFDTINGSGQDDSLYGGAGSDSILGFGGTDLIDGGMGWNILIGGLGIDILMGGADSDIFQWNAGDGFDFITGNGGEDYIDANGAAGGLNQFDVMRYGTAYLMNYNGDFNSGFEADGVPTSNFFSGANSAATANVEDLSGINVQRLAFYFSGSTTAAVTVNGSIADNVLTIGASPLDPTLQIISGLPYDFRMTGPVDPTLNTLTVQGLAGNDVITVEDSALAITEVVINGGDGNDLLTGANQIIGGAGNDTLQGGLGNDSLDGGAGDNLFLLSGGDDTLVGGTGFDNLALSGTVGASNKFSINQDNGVPTKIQVNGISSTLTMTDIDQISVLGSIGDDDLFVNNNATTAVQVVAYMGAGNDSTYVTDLANAQFVESYGESGNDHFIATGGYNRFFGGDDFDIFYTYESPNGFSQFDGGSGMNYLWLSGSQLSVTEASSGVLSVLNGPYFNTSAINVTSLFIYNTVPGSGNFTLSADQGDNTILVADSKTNPSLNPGDVQVSGLRASVWMLEMTAGDLLNISGNAGNDSFKSLGSNDATVNFIGGTGNDTFEVTQESRPANFSGGAGTDTVHVIGTVNGDALTFQASGPDEQISYNGADAGTVINAEILNVEGLAGNDLIQVFSIGTGSGLGEIDLIGGDGNDYISVQGLKSGTFNISGGDGNDTIYGADTPGVMVIHGGAGDDAITLGTAETAAYGEAGNDTLNGSSGADTLSGGDGNDLITGGTGSDQLDGGADDDVIVWNIGDGSDIVEGGTGQDELIVNGDSTAGNAFTVQPQSANSILFEVLIAAQVINSDAIEHVSLTGGTGSDSFNIGDLTGTGVILVDTNFGTDTVADTVSVLGSAFDDHIILAGTTTVAEVTGLAWTVRAENMAFSATTLVDGILIDGGRGYDWLLSGVLMDMPVLATLQGGAGADLFEVNTPALGDNANRVTVIASGDIFNDVIQLRNGRNRVIGGSTDIIEVSGTANNDTIVLDGVTTPGRVNIGVNSLSSSNDLTEYTGVIHINAEGGDDTITAGGMTQAATISGGVGNDTINASGMTVPVTIFGELGDDSITGGSAGDYIDGGNGWNSLAGGLGDDVVNGGSGTDQFTWNAGDGFDYFTGNGGDDYVLANGGAGGLNGFEVMRYSTVYYMQYNGDINQGFEADQVPCTNFTAGAGSTASATVQDMSGLDVSRLVFDFSAAATAAVSVDGTSGSDNLIAGINPYDPTLVEITGLTYQFRMIGTTSRIANALTINGLGGDDTLKSTSAADAVALITLDGGDGNDTLSADAILLGGAGNDTFIVPNGINTIDGGTGFNQILVNGTDGNDVIGVDQTATTVNTNINGIVSQNTVSNIQLVAISGLGGDDSFFLGGAGVAATILEAGDGNDRVDAANMTTGITINGGNGNDSLYGGQGADYITTGDGLNEVDGRAGNDTVLGGANADVFLWKAGNGFDIFSGGGGQDNLLSLGETGTTNNFAVSRRGTGYSLAYNGSASQGYTAQGVALAGFESGVGATAVGSVQDMTGISVSRIQFVFDTAASAAVTVDGSMSSNDIIVGVNPYSPTLLDVSGLSYQFRFSGPAGRANDSLRINGLGGNDSLRSTSAADALAMITLDGGDGDDMISGDAIMLGGAGNDTFLLLAGTNTIDGGTGFNQIVINGTAGNDQMSVDQTATSVNTNVNGMVSLNTVSKVQLVAISGLAGNDQILVGGAGVASTSIDAGDGNDLVDAFLMTTAVSISGGEGDDRIFGGSGNDDISTGNGLNFAAGGLGNDNIMGGRDTDVFAWLPGDGFDYISGGGAGLDYINATGDAGTTNDFAVSRYYTGFRFNYNSDANQGYVAEDIKEAYFRSGAGSTASGSVQDMNGVSVSRIQFEFSNAATATATVDGSMAANNYIVGVSPYVPTLIDIAGLTYQLRFTGTATPANNSITLKGLGGDDIMKATPAAEAVALITLDGGDGNDTLNADAILLGGAGNDTFIVPYGINTIDGGTGFNTIQVDGTNGPDTINVTQGAGTVDLSVNGVTSTNTVSNIQLINVAALAGNDIVTLSGSGTINTYVYAGDGSDNVNATGLAASVSLYGGVGDDTLIGGSSVDYIDGGDGFDHIHGGLGNDFIEGGSGGDHIFWFDGDGFDEIDGGDGDNMLSVYGSTTTANAFNVYVDPEFTIGFIVTINGATSGLDTSGIQGVDLNGGSQADSVVVGDLTGSTLRDLSILLGGDSVFGDTVVLNGTNGSDLIGVSGSGSTVTVSGLPFTVAITGYSVDPAGAQVDTIQVNGNAGYDTMYVNAALVQPVGVILDGGVGKDLLYSGAPDFAGQSPSLFRVSLIGGSALDQFYPTAGHVALTGSGSDILELSGNDLNNALSVTQSGNVLTYTVDASSTVLNVAEFTGLLNIDAAGGNDTVTLGGYAFASTVSGGLGNDSINATGLSVSVSIYGGSGTDYLTGGSGNDFLDGGDGSNQLAGGLGNDELSGGVGGDLFIYNAGDGVDFMDGGGGVNNLYVYGLAATDNTISVYPNSYYPTDINLDINGLAEAILAFNIEGVVLTGGTASDTFNIGDLTGRSVTYVSADFGVDTVADKLNVEGTANNDSIIVAGLVDAKVTGLPWDVTAINAKMNGNLIVDGVAVNGGLGDDNLLASSELTAMVTVTLAGGHGSDTLYANTGLMGVNPVRVTIDALAGTFSDTIYLGRGRNRVLGTADDLIVVNGTVNNDTVSINQAIEGTVISVNGVTSTNDLSEFLGVMHVDLLGGNDTATLSGYTIPTSVMGGDGNDVINASGVTVSISIYGGNGNDTFRAGSGDDYMEGNDGADEIYCSAGNDQIFGGADSDTFLWNYLLDGNDTIDGGTGQNSIQVLGNSSGGNQYTLNPSTSAPLFAEITGATSLGLLQGNILTTSIQQVSLTGGSGQDTFTVGDLTGTSVTIVTADFGVDTVADNLSVTGTANDDNVYVTGSTVAQVVGLPWTVSVSNSALNGSLLVDGISVDAGLGNDYVSATGNLLAPALVTLIGGRGADTMVSNSPAIGVNPSRVTLDASGGAFADTIYLWNGRNRVVGTADDVIIAQGSANNDTVSISQTIEGTVFNVNGATSTNDLSAYLGVIHVDLLGGNDTATLSGYTIPTSVMGGDGNDTINASGMTVPVSLYGGSGNDQLKGGSATDYIEGNDGVDNILGSSGSDQIYGGADIDTFVWTFGDGNSYFDGGTGQNIAVINGDPANSNQFAMAPDSLFQASVNIDLSNSLNVLQASIHTSSVQQISLVGGSGQDTFAIDDLLDTGVTIVDIDFGTDTGADTVSVLGDALNNSIRVTGTSPALIEGLPWLVRVTNAAMNGNLLVDGIMVDGGAGNDSIYSSAGLMAPVLVTIMGGCGFDDLRSGTGDMGVNPSRVTIDASTGDAYTDIIQLFDGRNKVIGSSDDEILVVGSAGNDTILISQVLQGTVINVNGVSSTNDLTSYFGVIDVDLQGGNDTATLSGYTIPTSVMGGDGNDSINASAMTVPVSLYGGSGDDSIRGGSANDYIEGNDGSDDIYGNAGNDRIYGGADIDTFYWSYGGGNDSIDGGTGQNNINVAGDPANGNVFDLAPLSTLQGVAQINLSNTSAVVQATILTASIQQISMIGGSGQDTFNIGDLTGTAVTIVNTDFGTDTVADNVSVVGDALNNSIRVTGTSPALVEGLAWVVKVTNAAMNGNLLVDGILVDGGAGNDSIYSSANLLAPVLVTIQGGVGFDDLRTGTGVMGVNPVRVTIHAGAIDIYSDTIQLFQGRNKVIGSPNDVILVSGSASNDTVALSQTLEGTVFNINGILISTNDLSEFEGVLHVDLLGGNDSATLGGYNIPTSVLGGDGNDLVNAGGLKASVSISGGSGNDTLRGSAFGDEISGDSGNDDIYAGTGDDTLTGGDGNDDFFWFAGDGLDLIDGGTGDDWAGFAGSTVETNAFTLTPLTSSTPSTAAGLGTGDANRVLVSYSSAQAAHIGDVEAVSLNGGGGCDSYGIGNLQTTDLRVVDVAFSTTATGGVVSTYATNLPDTITVTADAPNQIGVNGLAVPVRIFNANPAIAIVVHAGFGADTIEVDPVAETQALIVIDGGSGNDTITGGSIIIGGNGNNLLIGTDNPNTIVGGTGSDTIQGLGGNDLLFGDGLVTGLDQPGPDCDYLAGLVITPTATGAGDLIEGGEGDDSINGNVGADSLFGGQGNDDIGELTYKGVFFPESGNDVVDGGDGNNCVFSGEGDDSVVVGSGNNLLVLGAGNDTAVTGNGNNTIFAGSGNDTVTTGSGNDVVILGAGNDTAKLGSGNDLAWGEAGNDFIVGALGNDTIYGGSGNDTLWGGTQATKEVKNSSKVVTTPNDGNDVLAGEDGFDKLDGGTGNNIMDAGADNIRETMIGSGGWDTAYIHANEGKNQDVLKNHTSRYTLIPYGSMPIAKVPATPTNCDTPITVIIPNPLSGKLAKAPAKPKALPKASSFSTKKPNVK